MLCPLCKKGSLKAGEKMVRCSEFITEKNGNSFVNKGSCEFRIPYKYGSYGNFSKEDIKSLCEGKEVANKRGDKAKINLNSTNGFFVDIEYFKFKETDL